MLDFDDAIFHNYDMRRSARVRRIYGQRIDRLMEGSRLVIAGRRIVLQQRVQKRVEAIPTVVDLTRYVPKRAYVVATKPRIVWIGSPSTVQYLLDLAEQLAALAKLLPFTLRLNGGGDLAISGVDVEVLPWSEETEAASIAGSDIGVMPLRDSPWEQGKCADCLRWLR